MKELQTNGYNLIDEKAKMFSVYVDNEILWQKFLLQKTTKLSANPS